MCDKEVRSDGRWIVRVRRLDLWVVCGGLVDEGSHFEVVVHASCGVARRLRTIKCSAPLQRTWNLKPERQKKALEKAS